MGHGRRLGHVGHVGVVPAGSRTLIGAGLVPAMNFMSGGGMVGGAPIHPVPPLRPVARLRLRPRQPPRRNWTALYSGT